MAASQAPAEPGAAWDPRATARQRARRIVLVAVSLAFFTAVVVVRSPRGRPAVPDLVPIVEDGALRVIGGVLGDFDLSGDRLVFALGQRVVVGAWEAGAWAVRGATEPAPDGVRDVVALPGDRIAVLRGRHVCLVDIGRAADLSWDGCRSLELPARRMVAGPGGIAVETRDGALTVYETSGAAPSPSGLVLRPHVSIVGYAWSGALLAVIEREDRLCTYRPPDATPVACAERRGIKGLYRVDERLASYVGDALRWEDPATLAADPAPRVEMPVRTDALAGGHGSLAVQDGETLRWLAADEWQDGGDIAGRLTTAAQTEDRRCWARTFADGGLGLAGIRCVDRGSRVLELSLLTPGLVEHALALGGRILFSDAQVGVGRIDVAAGTIALLGPERDVASAHALAADERSVAVALGEGGVALAPRPFRSLAADAVLWRNREVPGAVAVALDQDHVLAGDVHGQLWMLDRSDGRVVQWWRTGGSIGEIVVTDDGVFVVDRVEGLLLAERTVAGGLRCCQVLRPGAVHGVSLRNGKTALALGDEGLLVTELQRLFQGPDTDATVATRAPALAAAWSGERVVVAERSGELELFDLGPDGRRRSIGVRGVGGVPERIFPATGGLLIASEFGGLALVDDPAALDVSAPLEPVTDRAPDVQLMTPLQLAEAIARGDAVPVDVRRPEEFAEAHIPGAINVPLTELPDYMAHADFGVATVVPYCVKDFRGYEALRLIDNAGVARLGAIDGFGLSAWRAAGLPVAGTSAGKDDAAALEALPAGQR